jgi:phage terminase small subunit
MSELKGKREAFCHEYIVDLNGAQAAIRAGYSPNAAKEQGSRLLTFANVQERIAQLMAERINRTKVDADYVLRRHIEIDRMDIADIMDDDGALKAIKEWPKVWRQYLSGFDLSELYENQDGERVNIGVLKKIKWPDKVKNLELLGKHVDVQAYSNKVDLGKENTLVPFSVVVAGVDGDDE